MEIDILVMWQRQRELKNLPQIRYHQEYQKRREKGVSIKKFMKKYKEILIANLFCYNQPHKFPQFIQKSHLNPLNYINKIQKMQQQILAKIQDDANSSQVQSQLAGKSIADGGLKIIYELILDLAYTLFIAAIFITITYDISFREQFTSYVKDEQNKGYIIVLIILGVIILALDKSYSQKTDLEVHIKKILNFIEDIVRGIIYLVMLIFVTKFIMENFQQILLVVSYVLYIISGVLFFALKAIKWVYYLCGQGKNNYVPWSTSKKEINKMEHFNEKQKVQLQGIFNDLINGKAMVSKIAESSRNLVK